MKILLILLANARGFFSIAAVTALLLVAAMNANPLSAQNVLATVTSARNPFASNIQISWKCNNTGEFDYADDVLINSHGSNGCQRLGDFCLLLSFDLSNKMKNHNEFPPYTEAILYCLGHDLLDDRVGQALFDIWHAGVCDEHIGHMIKRRASKHLLAQAMSGMPYRPPKLTEGDFVLGLDLQERRLLAWVQYLNAHSLIVAGSGAGKTIYSYFKILQIASQVRGMWLWDLRKREFRILRRYLARLGIDLVVVPGRSLRINPLQLPLGVEPADWIPRIADMLIEVLELPPRASKLLQSKLFRLYQRFGIFDDKTSYPTLFDLLDEVKKDKEGNPQARMAIIDSLDPVLLSLGPQVLAYRYGWSSHDLAGRHLVLELGGHAEVDKNLILHSLLLAEFTSRIARGTSNPTMDLWICCDEAQRLCSKSSSAAGHSAIGSQIGLVRGTGIGLDLSVQSMNDVIPQVPSNTATKVLGRCGSAADYQAAGHSMGLTGEQIQWAQLNLRPGLFIGQLGEGTWRHPFVFQVPLLNLTKVESNDSSPDVQPLKGLLTMSA